MRKDGKWRPREPKLGKERASPRKTALLLCPAGPGQAGAERTRDRVGVSRKEPLGESSATERSPPMCSYN